MPKTKKIKKFASLRDAYDRCQKGDQEAQRTIIGGLHNLGDPTMTPPDGRRPKWLRAYHGLQEYISALVGEYGESEDEAERSVLDEVNYVIGMCDDIKLED